MFKDQLQFMLTYREYQESDWKAICQIHDRARPDELRDSCDPRAFVPIELDKEVEDLKTSKKFVACDDEKVVGFVGVDNKYLAWLYIDPSHYGRGIGRELLRIGIREIGDGAWTIVLDGNQKAISLYKSEGFQEARRFAGDNAGYPCMCIRMERK
jgi:ribosomal protein S18 acetylase RimI-like enzyme